MIRFKLKLYKGKKLQNGNYPIVLQLTKNRRTFRLTTGYEAKITEFNDASGRFKKSVDNAQVKNENLQDILLMAGRIIDDFKRQRKPFNIDSFKDRFKRNNNEIGVYEFFDELKEEMRLVGRVNNAMVYYESKRALIRYRSYMNLSFGEIDYIFLKGFERHLLAEIKVKPNTASVYLRTLRAAYREAMRRGYIDIYNYPFRGELNPAGYSFSHLKSTHQPRALSAEDLEKLKNADFSDQPKLEYAAKLFLFSYYAFGINLKDMALLKKENIYEGQLRYTRSKTKERFCFVLNKEARNIINHFESDSDFLFPIFSDFHKTPMQQKDRMNKKRGHINTALKQIARQLEIDVNLTFYVARHTMATTLKRKQVSTDVIKEVMGHQDIKTTQIYLAKFGSEVINEAGKLL